MHGNVVSVDGGDVNYDDEDRRREIGAVGKQILFVTLVNNNNNNKHNNNNNGDSSDNLRNKAACAATSTASASDSASAASLSSFLTVFFGSRGILTLYLSPV